MTNIQARIKTAVRVVLLGSALLACARATSAPGDVVDQQLALAPGESARLAGSVVQVLRIDDSRCPLDATCITRGDAVVVVAFRGMDGERTDTLRLFGEPRMARYGGLLFQPIDVTPYPSLQNPPSSRSVTLRVTTAR